MKRYLKLRNRLNRLIARRDARRRPRLVHTVRQAGWSSSQIRRAIRKLHKRIRRVHADLRAVAAVMGELSRIAVCESHGNPHAIGGGGAFRGKYQFTYGTWASVGGRGDPATAPASEQDRRAALLMKREGRSPWPVCG